MTIVLASASPRRRELLGQIGAHFIVSSSDVVEDNRQQLEPRELAVLQAAQKAEAVAKEWFSRSQAAVSDVVVGADTIVVLDGQVYGKPTAAADAVEMLTRLSNRTHEVITGVAVVYQSNTMDSYKVLTDFSVTKVTFARLSQEQISAYVATGEPIDKAGSYAIQGIGALLVEKIEGDYTNVVGLPLSTLASLLEKAGMRLL